MSKNLVFVILFAVFVTAGSVMADELTGKTMKPRVWAGGDIVTGAATVISAMGAGKRAAASMDKYLRGEDTSWPEQ